MPVPSHLRAIWTDFAAACGGVDEGRFYDAFSFGDTAAMADELAALVLAGVKRATTGALWAYEVEGQRLAQAGDLSVVTDGAGRPLCVIETRSVEVMPFGAVGADFAAIEGEGDGSLAFWQDAHRAYFSRECAAAGRTFSESMPVVCEVFEVVYRPSVRVG